MQNKNFLIIESNYYSDISSELLSGAKSQISSIGGECEVINVPGALEIPLCLSFFINNSKQFNPEISMYIVLGCIIKGETSHYDHVCFECMHGVQTLAIENSLALGNGILTVENKKQAEIRSSINVGNKGKVAVEAAFALWKIKQSITKDL
ncbi:6,7-dimethyl-8-ribityllumazine synthase [Alphaproteobacteria bacterium]|nr:6,7-dimethyl-8-ribityllumazine synthase [Alphaproteobacteria bacterium]